MHRITRSAPDRLDLEFDGPIDRDGMRALLDELLRASEGLEHGRMLYRIRDFEWPSLGAMGEEIARMPEMLRLARRFERIAVLADEGWIRGFSRVEGALMPGLELRAFEMADEDRAEAWLAG